jgi:murein DD-endopeptidase MepM/ murein hydrolase activator NlpD
VIKITRPICLILAACVFATMWVADPCHAAKQRKSSRQQLMQRLANVARSIDSIQKKLAHTKKKQKSAAQSLAVAADRLKVTRANLHDTQRQLRDTRTRLAKARAELNKVQLRLDERNQLLSERLSDVYKHGNVSYASVLLGAGDFWDLLCRGHMLKAVINSDLQLVEAIKRDKAEVERHKAVLQQQESVRAELERRQAGLTRTAYAQTVERTNLLREANRERAMYEAKFAELAANSRQIESMIRSMQRTSTGKARYKKIWKGKFIMPVNGRITDRFGMRFHPILKQHRMHTGVDLACAHGTAIRAAASGVVIYSGWLGAYGNTIIIDHGGGVTTVYGHCSRLYVGNGRNVTQGQSIAAVGSTGWSTGPHCHFEVRRNGTPVQPF